MFQWSLITKHVEVTLSTASSLLLECTATFFNFIFPWEYSSICSHALQEMLAESSVILQNLFSALYLVSCWSACLAWNEKSLLIKVSLPLGIMVERDDSSRMCFIDPALEFQVTWLLLASIFWGNNWCRLQHCPDSCAASVLKPSLYTWMQIRYPPFLSKWEVFSRMSKDHSYPNNQMNVNESGNWHSLPFFLCIPEQKTYRNSASEFRSKILFSVVGAASLLTKQKATKI
jgi:hypothetical protein